MSYTEDKPQIRILHGAYKIKNQTEFKSNTLVLYELFKNAVEDELPLQNLHTIAQLCLDPKLKVRVDKEEDEVNEKTLYRYSIVPD